MSWGSLYPILNRLEKEAYLTKIKSKSSSGGPTQKTYSLTDKGRKHFHSLMLQPLTDSDDTRGIFRYKLLFFDKIKKDDRIALLKDYAVLASQRLSSIKTHFEEYKNQPSLSKYILEVLEHTMTTYRLEKDWVSKLLTEEEEI